MPVNPAAPLPANDQTDMTALLLAAAVHILLVGALFFSVQWRSQAPTAVAVEVWRSGPAPLPAPIIKPEPLPEPPPPPPPPKVEPKPEPKPLPPKVETPPVKPDIAVKEEKKKKEEPKKPEPKPVEVKKEEPKKEEPKKPEPDRREDLAEALARDLKQVQQQKAVHDQRARADADIKYPREQRHRHVGGVRRQRQHFHLHTEPDNHDRHAPEDAQQHQVISVVRSGQQQQQTRQQQADRGVNQP